MTVKLVLLKSGEELVADISEMVVTIEGENKVVGYHLDCPHKARLISDSPKEGNTKYRSRVQIIPWIPLSKDRTIPIPSDWVVTMVDPHDEVVTLYTKRVKEINETEAASNDRESYLVDPD